MSSSRAECLRSVLGTAVAVLCIPALSTVAWAQSASGIPQITDGDTVVIGETKIRLSGVDTPETDQFCFDASGKRSACGIQARNALQRQFGGQAWQCSLAGVDPYGRSVGSCHVGGADVQAWLVRNGWGLAYVKYSPAYVADQKAAEAARAGLWAGCFIAPWEWRVRSVKTVALGSVCPVTAQKELLDPAPDAPDPSCVVKGNMNRKGECIYHVPGGRSYQRTKINASEGDRWFCSRVEADAAGCRPAKR